MPGDKTLIIGIGNMLCCDEGVGIQVIQQMEFMELPGSIELLDMGTSTMDLISHLEGVKKLIVIDAMKTGGTPGEIHKCKPEDLMPKEEEPISLHEVNLLETLTTAKEKGMEIDTVIIGVEPKVIDWGLELSEEIKQKIPAIIEAVLEETKK